MTGSQWSCHFPFFFFFFCTHFHLSPAPFSSLGLSMPPSCENHRICGPYYLPVFKAPCRSYPVPTQHFVNPAGGGTYPGISRGDDDSVSTSQTTWYDGPPLLTGIHNTIDRTSARCVSGKRRELAGSGSVYRPRSWELEGLGSVLFASLACSEEPSIPSRGPERLQRVLAWTRSWGPITKGTQCFVSKVPTQALSCAERPP